MARRPWWLQWLIFTIVTLVLYAPIPGNSFLSDDWLVLHRLVMERQLNTNGFFRPLSDITIWFNYQLGGLNPFIYYLTGIIIRGLGALFFYRFCLKLRWDKEEEKRYGFALIATFLFLTYPFHSEPVVWILGRGALIAGTLAMAALLILVTKGNQWLKIGGVCLCYFVGLAAYETIVVLPLMVLAYMLRYKKPKGQIFTWQFFLMFMLALHIVMRVAVSGSLTGDYGSAFFRIGIITFVLDAAKATVRTVFPPSANGNMFIVLGIILLVLYLLISTRIHKLVRGKSGARKIYFIICIFWVIAMLLPFWVGVSTRTSENERFLELPSYFYCMLLAFLLMFLLKNTALRLALVILFAYNIYYLERTNSNWVEASNAVDEIMQAAKTRTADSRLFVIDLPGEINGAFVFRVGFTEALLINGIDTSRVQQVAKVPENLQPADKVYRWRDGKWNKLQ